MDCTKLTADGLLLADVFSKDVCEALVAHIETFEPERWYLRKAIHSKPTQGTRVAHYYFCGDRQQPREFRERLFALAPHIDGARLCEAVINRYEVGDYMPEHIDHALYRYNLVINLSECGDGVTINGEFLADQLGRALVFPARSAPHAVPPVTHRRYVVIYLYE